MEEQQKYSDDEHYDDREIVEMKSINQMLKNFESRISYSLFLRDSIIQMAMSMSTEQLTVSVTLYLFIRLYRF